MGRGIHYFPCGWETVIPTWVVESWFHKKFFVLFCFNSRNRDSTFTTSKGQFFSVTWVFAFILLFFTKYSAYFYNFIICTGGLNVSEWRRFSLLKHTWPGGLRVSLTIVGLSWLFNVKVPRYCAFGVLQIRISLDHLGSTKHLHWAIDIDPQRTRWWCK